MISSRRDLPQNILFNIFTIGYLGTVVEVCSFKIGPEWGGEGSQKGLGVYGSTAVTAVLT